MAYPLTKRVFDILCASIGVVALSPAGIVIALAIKLSDGGPVFFRQQRVGQGGKLFHILKFRSMVVGAEKLGPGVTREGDRRITKIGRFLRKTKLDELPQLWNVLIGDMGMVGPRPEVPRYVENYTAEQRIVLSLKPGITDLATIEFRNEEELLGRSAGAKEQDTEEFYVGYCVPRKIELNLAYAARANVWEDIKIILRTLLALQAGNDRTAGPGPAKRREFQIGHPPEREGASRRSAAQRPMMSRKDL